jgi:hypothetical protein
VDLPPGVSSEHPDASAEFGTRCDIPAKQEQDQDEQDRPRDAERAHRLHLFNRDAPEPTVNGPVVP